MSGQMGSAAGTVPSKATAAKRVVVVGGGLAGIAAALELADRGATVTLVERRTKLGGLTWSFQRKGLWFDNGQHVFLRCCSAYRQFLDRIGASGDVHLQARLDIPVLAPGGKRATITRSHLPAPLHLVPALLRYSHLSVVDRARLGRAALALRTLDPDDPTLDTITFGAWLAKRGQHPAAIERLWDLIALPTINVRANEASLALAVKVFRTGLLDTADGGDVGWSSVPLGQLHGAHAQAALDRAGVETLLGARVADLTEGRSARWTVGLPERVLEADAVIVTTPPSVTKALLPDGLLPDVDALGTSPIVNVHFVLDRRVTDLQFCATVDSPAQFVFDRTDSSGLDPTTGQVLAVSLSGADEYVGRRPEDLIETFFAALGDLFPAARNASLRDAVVTREQAATFRGAPGQAALRPGARTARPGLLLAGSWCDTGWPATMEGAVRSGTTAAAAALDEPFGAEGDSAPGFHLEQASA